MIGATVSNEDLERMECICPEPNVMDLSCPVHGPIYQEYHELMMRPSLTDKLQQELKKHPNEKYFRVPNRKMKRKKGKK